MKLKVADPSRTLNSVVEVPRGITVGELKCFVQDNLSYDTSDCLVFGHNRIPWADSQPITVEDHSVFVFYNRKTFTEKSYPSIDSAFSFPSSRFGNFQDDFGFPPFPGGSPSVDLLIDESDYDPSDEDSPADDDRPGQRILRIRALRRRLEQLHEAIALRRGRQLPMGLDGDEDLVAGRRLLTEGLAEESEGEEEERANTEATEITLTSDEQAAVRRLHALLQRLDFSTVVQVYLACDRDEGQTQQCLLSMA